MLYLFIKKVTSNFYKTIDLSLYYQYVVKFLNYFQPYLRMSQKNSLLCPTQSSFCSFDSCKNQLLSTVYEIYANFDQHPTLEVRAYFLDI